MPRILIAGCGYVGTATAKLFCEAGWDVEGWTASQASAAELSTMPFRIRAVDISERDSVSAAASNFDALIQCVSTQGGDVDAYRRIYLEGARNLRAVFPQALPLLTSSTSVYAQEEGEWVTEQSATEPKRATARILREAEEFVLEAGGIVARLAGIYGPGRSALYRKFNEGTAVIGPASDRFVNQVHRDDIADALLLLVREGLEGRLPSRSQERRIFNVSDNHPIPQRDCYQWLASHLGQPMPPLVPVSSERKRGDSNKRVTSAKLESLGWAPRFPTFQAGMIESVLPSFGA